MPSKHPLPDFVGHLVANGRFLLLELLGAGSYGKVYRAVDTTSLKRTEEHYAVKCIHRYKQGSRRDTLQKREFSAHAKVSGHPNITTFHEVFYDRLYLYVILDLCLGGDLCSTICESRLLHNDDALLKSILSNSSTPFNIVMNKVYFTVTSSQRMSCARKAAPRSSLPILVWRQRSKIANTVNAAADRIGVQNASTRGGRARRIRQDEVTFGHSESFWSTCCSIAFLRDSAFFHESFPFSSGTIDILLRIFVIRPGERITLSELRGAILRLDTFFLSREVLCHAPKLVRDFASWKHPDCDSLSKERLDSTSPASNRPPVNLHSPDDFLSNAHRKSRPRGLGKITLGRLLGF